MSKVSVYNMEGQQVGELELNDAVFGVEINEHLVNQAVKLQLADKRQGTERKDTFRSERWRKKALEAEGYRPCKTGFNKSSTVDRRWCCICSKAKRLFIQDE